MEFKTMQFTDIVMWCKDNGQIPWVKEQFTDGKNPSFITLKRAFCKKFMPELIPVASKPKKPSMREMVEGL